MYINKIKFTTYRNKLKTLLEKAAKEFYAHKLNECHGNLKKTWKIINNLMTKSDHDNSSDSIEFNYNNSPITDKKIIGEKFNDYFIDIGKNLAEKIPISQNSYFTLHDKKHVKYRVMCSTLDNYG